jgi:steroid delta-isomerase-like uncharacterized protein
MQDDRLQEFAQRYATAWCSQDAASVAAFYSRDGSLSLNDGAPAVGRSAIADVAQSFMIAFPNLRVILNEVTTRDDHARYHWTLTGTNTGSGGTGHTVRISGFESWRFGDDGLIASSQGHFDSTEYRRQLEQGM